MIELLWHWCALICVKVPGVMADPPAAMKGRSNWASAFGAKRTSFGPVAMSAHERTLAWTTGFPLGAD